MLTDMLTNDELAASIEAYNKTVPKKKQVIVIRDPKDGGVYLSSTRPGSAIVEGGYRGFHKVDPKGEAIAVMSDEHNFLENAPFGVGKAIGQYLPNDLLGITPAIRTNILKEKKYAQAGTKKNTSYAKGDTMKNDLREMGKVQPSDEAVRAEEIRQAGMMTIGANELDKER